MLTAFTKHTKAILASVIGLAIGVTVTSVAIMGMSERSVVDQQVAA